MGTRRKSTDPATALPNSDGKPQLPWFAMPIEYISILPRKVSGAVQMHAIARIICETNVCGLKSDERPAWAKITQRQFASNSGFDVRSFEDQLAEAIEAGLILAKKSGRSMLYSVAPATWAEIEDYTVRFDRRKAEKDAAAEEENAAAKEEPKKPVITGDTMVLLPGKKSGVPVRVLIKGVESQFHFACVNDIGMPLCINHRTDGSRFGVPMKERGASLAEIEEPAERWFTVWNCERVKLFFSATDAHSPKGIARMIPGARVATVSEIERPPAKLLHAFNACGRKVYIEGAL